MLTYKVSKHRKGVALSAQFTSHTERKPRKAAKHQVERAFLKSPVVIPSVGPNAEARVSWMVCSGVEARLGRLGKGMLEVTGWLAALVAGSVGRLGW